MSRIRSIHPGIWTDEEFVTVSAFARLFYIGLWNECDDKGGFAWSPLKLKMRILPADNVDAAALLSELEANGSIKKYEFDGKSYGAVRNFAKYQRPKKPNDIYPMTAEIRHFCGITTEPEQSGTDEVPNQLPTASEIAPQMEEGGGRMEEITTSVVKKTRVKKSDDLRPDGVTEQVWNDFIAIRQAKKAPITATALAGIRREAEDVGWTLAQAVEKMTVMGWQGFKASWIRKEQAENERKSSNSDKRDGAAMAIDKRLAELARTPERPATCDGYGTGQGPIAAIADMR